MKLFLKRAIREKSFSTTAILFMIMEIFFCFTLNKVKKDHRSLKIPNQSLLYFHSYNHQAWLPDQIIGGKPLKNIQISSQTLEIWRKQLNVTLYVSEEKLSFN